MAIDKTVWKQARVYFELGKSLSFISEKLGISKSTISERSKKENWEKRKNEQLKSDIIEVEEEKRTLEIKKRTITEQLSKLEDYEVEILNELVEDEARIRNLIFSTTALNVIRVNQNLQNNVKLEKINIGDGIQQFEEVGLGSSDYKSHQDTLDKASLTLGVNNRHMPKDNLPDTDNDNKSKIIRIERVNSGN